MALVKVKSKTASLSVAEKEELRANEEIIDKNQKAFFEVGAALLRIRDGWLYRAAHKTFEAYVQDRWEMKRSRAYQLIDSVQALENVHNCGQNGGPKPANEAHVRPLVGMEPEQQAEVWKKVVESGRRVSEKGQQHEQADSDSAHERGGPARPSGTLE